MHHDKTNPGESKLLLDRFAAIRAKGAALDRSKTLANQGYGAYLEQDWPKAIGLLREAPETCGDCEIQATLHKNLGLALCRSGNLTEGGGELQKALSLNPNDTDVVKALSVIGRKGTRAMKNWGAMVLIRWPENIANSARSNLGLSNAFDIQPAGTTEKERAKR